MIKLIPNNVIKISDTMKGKILKTYKPIYLVLKLGNQSFSTIAAHINGEDFERAILQENNSKAYGFQSNINIKGVFKERENHIRIVPVPFEINFYSQLDGLEVKQYKLVDWDKVVCDGCATNKHLYCEECNKYAWEIKKELREKEKVKEDANKEHQL